MSGTIPDDANPALIPAIPAPSGLHSNLINPSNDLIGDSVATYSICLTFLVLAITTRTFTKVYLLRAIAFEDYASIVSSIGGVVTISLSILALKAGSGAHEWDISILGASHINELVNMDAIIYFPGIALAKFSVLWQLVRIFVPLRTGPIYWSTLSLIIVNCLFYGASLVAWVLQCIPLRKTWDFAIEGTCYVNPTALFVAGGAFNALSDLLMLLLPLYSIWHLKMAIKRKVGVSAIFATGLFALIASIVRLVFSIPTLTHYDVTQTYHRASLWTFVEWTTIIVVGCMPTLPRFIQFITGKVPAKKVYQHYKDTPLNFSYRKKSKTNMSSLSTSPSYPGLPHSYTQLNSNSTTEQIRVALPAPTYVAGDVYGYDEEAALKHEINASPYNITKTVQIETSQEDRAQ